MPVITKQGARAFRALCREQGIRKSNGMVLYEGPSMLDPSVEIVVIATGLLKMSANAKTGPMVQTWILVKGVSPTDAAAAGLDAAVCGGCYHRGDPEEGRGRSCYVTLFQGPRSVQACYEAGGYPHATPEQARAILAGSVVRFGAYGDPAAAPPWVWSFRSDVESHTGYTHQWRDLSADVWGWLMASADSLADRAEAVAAGWRTFRVRRADEPLDAGEVVCPASDESTARRRASCDRCNLCTGTRLRAKSPAIIVHGARAGAF